MQLKKISFPVLSYIEAIELRSMNSLKEIDMPKLKQVNNLSLGYMPALENLNCLGTLEAVNGILRLEYLTGLAEPTTGKIALFGESNKNLQSSVSALAVLLRAFSLS